MFALFVFSGSLPVLQEGPVEQSLVLLGVPRLGGLHYPLSIPKLSPSFLFLSLYPKFLSPIFGVLGYPCIKGPYRAENPVVTLCYNHAALPSIIAPAQRPRAVGNAKPVVT